MDAENGVFLVAIFVILSFFKVVVHLIEMNVVSRIAFESSWG